MQSLDYRVINQAVDWIKAGFPIWLCTVLHTYGSSPRAPGSMLVARAEGEFMGSLSGGCVEDDFLTRISTGEFCLPSQMIRYGQGGYQTPVELPCGGSLDVLIEHFQVTEASMVYLNLIQRALKGELRLNKSVVLPEAARLERIEHHPVPPTIVRNATRITQPIGCVPTLLVAGYSAVAHDCIRLAEMLGFEVILCEHREEQLRQCRQDFVHSQTLSVVMQHPARYLEKLGASFSTAIVSLTHDPRIDDLTLTEAVTTEAFYIGVMGSKANSIKRRDRLLRISELTPHQLERIDAPIGLPIGSKTPAEIALSIMAHVVQKKNVNRGA